MESSSLKVTEKRKLISKGTELKENAQIFVSKMIHTKKLIRYYETKKKEYKGHPRVIMKEKEKDRKRPLIKMKMMKSLSFDIYEYQRLDFRKYKHLSKLLTKMKIQISDQEGDNINDFRDFRCLRKLEIDKNEDVSNEIFRNFNKRWKVLKHLQSFVGCFLCNSDNVYGLKDFGKNLRTFTALKDLKLYLSYFFYDRQLEESFKNITNIIGPCNKSLQNLVLVFDNCFEIGQQEFRHLGKMLESGQPLQSLSLNFTNSNFLTGKDISVFSKKLELLDSLQRFSLNIPKCSVTNEGFLDLSKSLSKLTSLEGINLNLESLEGITEGGLLKLTETLKNLEALQEVSLNFGSQKSFSDKSMLNFCENLGEIKSMKKINLTFSNCLNVTDKGLICLDENLFSTNESLESITLDLSEIPLKITDKGLSNLGKDWGRLKNLQKVDLNFEYCKLIKNKGISSLSKNLGAIPSLKNISLCFNGCDNLDEKGLCELINNLKMLNCLSDIALHFNRCIKIQDEGVISLGKDLKEFKPLESLQLSFCNCPKLTNEGVAGLIKSLKLLQKLKYVKLDFSWCEVMSDSSDWKKDTSAWASSLESFTLLTENILNRHTTRKCVEQ